MPLTFPPVIAIHVSAALAALVLGPFAIWARKGSVVRPSLHRSAGYAWVAVMLIAAISCLFIRDYRNANLWGYTYVHLLAPFTFYCLAASFYKLYKGNIQGHRKTMQRLYYGACVTAGLFALSPMRRLGDLLWHQWLGLM